MKANSNLSPEADRFLAQATAEFNKKQAAMERDWKVDSHKQWGFDQTTGVLKLEFADGAELHADGQILGSYSAGDGSWEWAWHNPNSLRAISRDSRKVREAGKKYDIAYLQAGVLPVPNQEYVAYLCAIGLKATGSIGIYCGKAGPIDVYIMLKNPRWTKDTQDGGDRQDDKEERPRRPRRKKKKKAAVTRDWRNFNKTKYFDVPDEDEAEYEPDEVATHRRVVMVGNVFAAIGLVVGVVLAIAVVIGSMGALEAGEQRIGRVLKALVFGLLLAIGIPVGLYFYGTNIGLLFTPTTFLEGPIGKKWLKMAGVKSPIVARILCALLLVFSTAIVVVVAVLIWIESSRPAGNVPGRN
jgi:hypothetical protein